MGYLDALFPFSWNFLLQGEICGNKGKYGEETVSLIQEWAETEFVAGATTKNGKMHSTYMLGKWQNMTTKESNRSILATLKGTSHQSWINSSLDETNWNNKNTLQSTSIPKKLGWKQDIFLTQKIGKYNLFLKCRWLPFKLLWFSYYK